jgi:hypothetical protein
MPLLAISYSPNVAQIPLLLLLLCFTFCDLSTLSSEMDIQASAAAGEII